MAFAQAECSVGARGRSCLVLAWGGEGGLGFLDASPGFGGQGVQGRPHGGRVILRNVLGFVVAGGGLSGSGDFDVHRFVDPTASFRKLRRGIGIDVGERWFGQGVAALLCAAVEAGGVAAQAEDQRDRDVFRHREADRAEDGEAERDDLGDRRRSAGLFGP